jgi:hypothetical protein
MILFNPIPNRKNQSNIIIKVKKYLFFQNVFYSFVSLNNEM